MSNRFGYRGYIGSRVYNDTRTPQHVQNLVIRDYCQRNGFKYLLSATEYAMESCYIMLEDVVREAVHLDGVVLYSMFMLPVVKERRVQLVRRVLDAGATLHGALESIAITNEEQFSRAEDIWLVQSAITGGAQGVGSLSSIQS